MPQKFLQLIKTRIFYQFLKLAFFVARPSKKENGTSDIIPGLCSHPLGYCPYITGLVFSAFSILLKEHLFNSKNT